MSGLIESATAILSASERRLEIISQNISNVSTPGYKRQIGFAELVRGPASSDAEQLLIDAKSDFAQAKLTSTGNPLDLAISGGGFFQLRDGARILYSRQGQFRRADDGTIVTVLGHVLQQAGGGDLVLDRASVEILEDGTVLDQGQPVARIGVFAPASGVRLEGAGGSVFSAGAVPIEEAGSALIRQGMLEASNVETGDEMVAMMSAMRHAEGGARLVQLYDELMGRAITSLGQASR
jgi:flagellar basal-body rod protein FlgG